MKILVSRSPRQQRHIGEHILGEDAVAHGRVSDEDVRDCLHGIPALDNCEVAHECGQ